MPCRSHTIDPTATAPTPKPRFECLLHGRGLVVAAIIGSRQEAVIYVYQLQSA